MVHLTRIYTRTGDAGRTRLADMSLTTKTDPRVEAYGDVDEANSAIGVALAAGGLPEPVARTLRRVQNELFDAGADLSTPLTAHPRYPPLRITQDYVDRLEADCDGYGDPLPNLHSFILPGGTLAAAQLHVARTIVRRAERAAWRAVERYGTEVAEPAAEPAPEPVDGSDDETSGPPAAGGVNLLAITYLNRLSDLLFILTRVANGADGDVLWVPGGDRDRDRSPTDQESDT
ncbi:MAG TPA: cob(I)yrinic acid a,c-diamide adenosyltransferase [Microlunatus sp.]|nr:cob(I)yrinic acid a,c-diamide adenosyltransferase [Microlunatus sp.]